MTSSPQSSSSPPPNDRIADFILKVIMAGGHHGRRSRSLLVTPQRRQHSQSHSLSGDWPRHLLRSQAADARPQKTSPPKVTIWQLLARAKRDPVYSQIAILAWGGYGKTTLLRHVAYTEQNGADRLDLNTLLWVRDLNANQRRAFVEKWYWCQEYYHHGKEDIPTVRQAAQAAAEDLLQQINQREELANLTKNPLLLNMISMFHRRYPSAELPKRRVELYQEMCLLQLRDRPGARAIATCLGDCDAQGILQRLALEMMVQKEERIDQAPLLAWLAAYLQAQEEPVAAEEFLDQVEQVSELLVQREPEEYEFAHLSFQEFGSAPNLWLPFLNAMKQIWPRSNSNRSRTLPAMHCTETMPEAAPFPNLSPDRPLVFRLLNCVAGISPRRLPELPRVFPK